MAIRIVEVDVIPQNVLVGQNIEIIIKVSEGNWNTVKSDFSTWQELRNEIMNWDEVKKL